jgi:hypothetical protein
MELVLMEMILNQANTWGKEEMMLTIERPMTTNSREPNMTRIILLRLNTAYALEPHTATRREDRMVEMKKPSSVGSIRLEEARYSLIMPIRPKTLRIAQIRYPASQL